MLAQVCVGFTLLITAGSNISKGVPLFLKYTDQGFTYYGFKYHVTSPVPFLRRISLPLIPVLCYARTFKMKLRNRYIYVHVLHWRGVLTSVLQESQGLTTYAFLMLLLPMISLHMLTFRLMVTMVAEFCSLVILIHNTLLGEITISST